MGVAVAALVYGCLGVGLPVHERRTGAPCSIAMTFPFFFFLVLLYFACDNACVGGD